MDYPRVISDANGCWGIVAPDGRWLSTGLSNRAAWREMDRLSDELADHQYAVSDWKLLKQVTLSL